MKIPFSPPDITQSEIDAVAEVLRSGWITTGPATKEFEKEIEQYIGCGRAACLNSATAAMELTLRLLGIGDGDEVIVPAYTYTATASVVCHVGAKPVMIDTAPNSFEMDYEKARAALSERTKAIMPVDVGGKMCDYAAVFALAEEGAKRFHPSGGILKAFGRPAVIADAAHSFGSIQDGKRFQADFSCYSFHAVKNLTTAEGGAVVWKHIDGVDDEQLYHEFMLASLHGQSKDALAKTKLGAWEYDIISPAYKCNMTDIMAAIGRVQLSRYPKLLARRREIIRAYDAAFKPLKVDVLEHLGETYTSNGHLYLTRVPSATCEIRNRIIEKMAASGISCNVHYKPLPMMTAYKTMGMDIADYPNAFRQYENEITLPLHTLLSDEQVAYIIEHYIRILKEEKCV